MKTYYTTENFLIFIGALALLLTLLLFSISSLFRRLPDSLKISIRGTILAIPVSVLSRVCPYPRGAVYLGYFGAAIFLLSTVLSILGGLRWYRRYSRNGPMVAGPDEIDDWIVSFLAGRFLLIDPLGNILAGSLDMLETFPEPESTAFFDFVDLLAGRYSGQPDLNPFFDSLYRLEDVEGDLESGESFFHCRLSQLDEREDVGYLFFIRDFSEEQQLLFRRDEQEKLAGLRMNRIDALSESEVHSARTVKAAGFLESFSKVVDAGMENLSRSLEGLAESEIILQEDVDEVLEQCRRTMNAVRTAVHVIDTGE